MQMSTHTGDHVGGASPHRASTDANRSASLRIRVDFNTTTVSLVRTIKLRRTGGGADRYPRTAVPRNLSTWPPSSRRTWQPQHPLGIAGSGSLAPSSHQIRLAVRAMALHRNRSTYRTQDTVVTPWAGQTRPAQRRAKCSQTLPVCGRSRWVRSCAMPGDVPLSSLDQGIQPCCTTSHPNAAAA